MQVLFELDFNDSKKNKAEEILKRNLKEFAPGLDDSKFVEKIVKGVLKEQKKIDTIIKKTAPEWPLEQIAIIDRNVLRIGLYELLFGNPKDVPKKVAINESIELAKSFGGETSGKFVNGVLGTVYRELPESEKEDDGPNKDPEKIDCEEKKGGAVVYRKENLPDKAGDDVFLALVHDVFGYWTLSKGGIEEGEDEKEGTIREIKEKMGIDIKIKESLGENDYVASHPEKGRVKKSVFYFLAETKDKGLKLGESGGLDDVRWFKLEDLEGLKIYDDLKPIILKAIKIIKTPPSGARKING